MDDRPRYMISIAAELVGMHPQTLRLYEAKGLVRPRRTPGGTRLYSDRDVARLKQIQRLSGELGLTLLGIEHVLGLQDTIAQLRDRVARLESELDAQHARAAQDVAAVHRSYRREIVLWEPPRGEIVRRQPYQHPRPQKD